MVERQKSPEATSFRQMPVGEFLVSLGLRDSEDISKDNEVVVGKMAELEGDKSKQEEASFLRHLLNTGALKVENIAKRDDMVGLSVGDTLDLGLSDEEFDDFFGKEDKD